MVHLDWRGCFDILIPLWYDPFKCFSQGYTVMVNGADTNIFVYFCEHLHTLDGDLMPMFRFSCWSSNVSPFSLISKQIVTCSFIVMRACMYKISRWFGLKLFQRSCNDQDQLRALKVQRANSSVDPCRVIKILKSWGIHTCKAYKHLGGVEVAHTVQTKEFWQVWTVITPFFCIN